MACSSPPSQGAAQAPPPSQAGQAQLPAKAEQKEYNLKGKVVSDKDGKQVAVDGEDIRFMGAMTIRTRSRTRSF